MDADFDTLGKDSNPSARGAIEETEVIPKVSYLSRHNVVTLLLRKRHGIIGTE
jgi:hypothetical protein